MSPKKRCISIKACAALLFYLIIPCFALLLIMQMYPELSQNRFYTRIYWILPTATFIVLFAQLSACYQKGDTKRFLLNIGFVIATIIWIYGVLGGGVVMTSQWNGYSFAIHMNKYVLLIACVTILNVIYYILEWKVYHKEKANLPSHKKKMIGVIVE
jgi:hypothetical protein